MLTLRNACEWQCSRSCSGWCDRMHKQLSYHHQKRCKTLQGAAFSKGRLRLPKNASSMLYVFTSGQMNTAIRPQELCEAEQLTEPLWSSFPFCTMQTVRELLRFFVRESEGACKNTCYMERLNRRCVLVQSLRSVWLLVSVGLRHTRPPCPSLSPGFELNSCPSGRWCQPTISPSVSPFSSLSWLVSSYLASGSFPVYSISHSFPLYVITKYWQEVPVLYSRSLLVIWFIHLHRTMKRSHSVVYDSLQPHGL